MIASQANRFQSATLVKRKLAAAQLFQATVLGVRGIERRASLKNEATGPSFQSRTLSQFIGARFRSVDGTALFRVVVLYRLYDTIVSLLGAMQQTGGTNSSSPPRTTPTRTVASHAASVDVRG